MYRNILVAFDGSEVSRAERVIMNTSYPILIAR
jgi:hypothetical protein